MYPYFTYVLLTFRLPVVFVLFVIFFYHFLIGPVVFFICFVHGFAVSPLMFFHSFVVVVLCFPVPVFSPVIAVVGVWPMIVYHQLHLWNYTQVYISVHNRQRSTCTPVSAVHVNIHAAMKVVIEILLWKINVGVFCSVSVGRCPIRRRC